MARRNFQEIRADFISSGTQRKTEENIRSAFNENTVKKLRSGIAPGPLGSRSSAEEKTPRQSEINVLRPLCDDIFSKENKMVKKQYGTTPESRGSDVLSTEKKTLRKPRYRTAPEPPGSDISSVEKKTLKKLQYETVSETKGSDISSMERITIKKPQHWSTTGPRSSDVSSMEKRVKKVQHRTVPKPPHSDSSSMVEAEKKPQYGAEPVPGCSDISSMEKTKQKNQDITQPGPLCSDVSSQETKTKEENENRTAPEPLGSDASSGATLRSHAGTLTDSCKTLLNDNALPADPCTGFGTEQACGMVSVADTSIGLNQVKANAGGNVTIDGSADRSSLGDDNSENSDEFPGTVVTCLKLCKFIHIARFALEC